MLVLSRERDETIVIGDDIEVTIVDIRAEKVRVGVNAPRAISVHRKEIYDLIKKSNPPAPTTNPAFKLEKEGDQFVLVTPLGRIPMSLKQKSDLHELLAMA